MALWARVAASAREHVTSSPRRKVLLVVIALGITTAYCAFLGFCVVFKGSPGIDDEGYLLATFRSYVADGGLYSTTYTQYGPGYYSLFGTLFQVLGISLLSLTPGRMMTLFFLVATSSAAAVAVWLATKRLLVAIAAQLFLFGLLKTAVAAPLHPGHYLVFLLALIALMCFLPRRRWPLLAPAAMGTLLALMVTTKVNVGVLATAGCVLAVWSASSSRRVRAIALLLLPAVPVGLMARDLNVQAVRLALVIVVGAVVAHVAIADGPRDAVLNRRSILTFLGSAILVSALACVPVLLRGTSLLRLVDGAIIDPARFASKIYDPIRFDNFELIVLVTLPALLLVGGALIARRIADEPEASWLVGAVKLAGGVLAIAYLSLSSTASLAQMLVLTALGAVPLRRYSADGLLGRRVLVMIAVLQPLHGYPVGASQTRWGAFLIGLVAFINVGDGLSEIADIFEFARERSHRLSILPSVLGLVMIAGIVAGQSLEPTEAYRQYSHLPSLDLPGAGMVRVTAAKKAEFKSVVRFLESSCDSYYSLPGLNTFYVFAQMPLVTGRNAGAWTLLYDDKTQTSVVQDLRAFPGRLCLLRNDRQLEAWQQLEESQQGRPLRRGPLVQFLDQYSEEVGRAGDYVVLRRPTSG